ncbi:golgin subfamily A member 4-like isoform X2 [Gigantopelta aegis]|uniref:golgin subfamily A member 4-like isoform X2 n=1 Tax=Gigantopelta aegis TaxID=1735272 RepID=UPI001B88E054|nr:golgin subfamily A member 4-like isoform X2 [Gigantopelta aegis]
MFKNLRKKFEQGVAQSPLALRSAVEAITKSDADVPVSDSKDHEADTDRGGGDGPQARAASQEASAVSGEEVPTDQLVDVSLMEEPDDSQYETVSDTTPTTSRSRTSSFSSVASDSSFYQNPISFAQPQYIPSDVESEVEESPDSLDSISKEDLYTYIKKYERRAIKYKTKFLELATVYKDMIQEREKIKNALAQSQDRAFRRISELKEQIQLDQAAKRDLEENYNFILEEKEEYIKVLHMQVDLLKQGKAVPPELQEKLISKIKTSTPKSSQKHGTEVDHLNEKVKRLEGLLSRCKETIKNLKEKNIHVAEEKDDLKQKLLTLEHESEKFKLGGMSSPPDTSKLQNQIKQARQMIEQLEKDREIAIAGVKQQFHEQIAEKDEDLQRTRQQCQQAMEDVAHLNDMLHKLEKAGQEQLDKSREIIKKLNEEKKQIKSDMEAKLLAAEQSLEDEKQNLIQEIKRGKTEAIHLMQQEMEQKEASHVEDSIKERDQIWQTKMSDQEKAHQEAVSAMERQITQMQDEIRRQLEEKDRQMQLAVEECQLQKMSALSGLDTQKDELQAYIEKLNSEKIELKNQIDKLLEDRDTMEGQLQLEMDNIKLKYERELSELKSAHAQEVQCVRTEQLETSQSLQEATSEQETYYQSQMEAIKKSSDKCLDEKKKELENSEEQLKEARASLEEKERELQRRTEEYESQITKLEQILQEKEYTNQKLQKDIINIQTDFESKKCCLEQHIVELTAEIKGLEECKAKLESDFHQLVDQTDTLRSEHEINMKNMSEEKEQFIDKIRNLETVKQQLEQQVETLSKFAEEKTELLSLIECKEREIVSLEKQLEHLKKNIDEKGLEVERMLKESASGMQDSEQKAQQKIHELEDQLNALRQQLETVASEKEFILLEKGDLDARLVEKDNNIMQLKEMVRSLENCQSAVEGEKSDLESKLVTLEGMLENLQMTKSELTTKLEESSKLLDKQASEDKVVYENRIAFLEKDLSECMQKVAENEKYISSKGDEVLALRTAIDDNSEYIKSLESKVNDLEQNLQQTVAALNEKSAELTKSVEKFNQLKAEAKSKIKELRQSLEQTNIKHEEEISNKGKEYQEQLSVIKGEQEEIIKQLSDQLASLKEQLSVDQGINKNMEESFKLQFEEQKAKYKETIDRMKKKFEEKIKEKESELHELFEKEVVGVEDVRKRLESASAEQLQQQASEHQMNIDKLTSEWETKIEEIKQINETVQEEMKKLHQEAVNELELKHTSKLDSLKASYESQINSLQSELDQLKSELLTVQDLLQEKENILTESNAETSETYQKFQSDIERLKDDLSKKDIKLEELEKSFEEKERLIRDTENLTGERKTQNEEICEKFESELQEKDVKIQEMGVNVLRLESELSSMEEMLKALNSVSEEKDEEIRKIKEECVEHQTRIQDLQNKLAEAENNWKNIQYDKKEHEGVLSQLHEEHASVIFNLKTDFDEQLRCKEKICEQIQGKVTEFEEKVKTTEERLAESIQNYETRIQDYQLKLECQDNSAKEEISQLKQRCADLEHEAHLKCEELQTSLNHEAKESEESLLEQLHTSRQDVEQVKKKADEIKQKFVVKMKEFQAEAKSKITALQDKLLQEVSEKEDISSELSHANTRLLQLQEHSGLSKDTIIDLEKKCEDLVQTVELKDSELAKLTEESNNRVEVIKNLNLSLENNAAEIEHLKQSLCDTQDTIEKLRNDCANKNSEIEHLTNNCEKQTQQLQELTSSQEMFSQKLTTHLEEKEETLREKLCCIQKLEEKCQDAQKTITDLEEQVDSWRKKFDENSQHVQELSGSVECLKESTKAYDDMKDQLEQLQVENNKLKEEHGRQLEEMQEKHSVDLRELTTKLDAESNKKVADYKKRAEAYITQVKKQLGEEKEADVAKHQEIISKHEAQISNLMLQLEEYAKDKEGLLNDLDQLKEKSETEHQSKDQSIQQALQQIELCKTVESDLRSNMDQLRLEKSELGDKHSVISKEYDQLKLQFEQSVEKLNTEKSVLQKQVADIEREKIELAEMMENQHSSEVEKLKNDFEDQLQARDDEQTVKIKQLVKEMNLKLAEKEREFEQTFSNAVDKSERGESRLVKEHQDLVEELWNDLHEKEERIEEIQHEYEEKLQEKDKHMLQQIAALQEEITKLKSRHQVELYELEEKFKLTHKKSLIEKEKNHQEEVTALTQEWNCERKFEVPCAQFGLHSCDVPPVNEEMVQQNQLALTAVQAGSNSGDLLRDRVVQLTKQMEHIREQHNLEVAELRGQLEMRGNLAQPLVAAPKMTKIDIGDPNLASEIENLELYNIDLQSQAAQLNHELSQTKLREQELQQRIEVLEYRIRNPCSNETPPLSPAGSQSSHGDGPLLREPTEFEYLRNILYEYMMGKETKTLAKVIATVVRFSDEQTRNILAKTDSSMG